MRIGNRPIGLVLRTATDPAHPRGLARGLRVYRRPLRTIARYASARGAYPWTARLRTPLGERPVRCRTWHDLVTVHEVFARHDYAFGSAPATVLDCGANIGVASLWALTRRPDCQVLSVEPVEDNLAELRRNLAGLEDRYELAPVAVAAEGGTVDFGLDQVGRYGGIGRRTGNMIQVQARGINELIDQCLERWERIDLLKLDVEGQEIPILRALDESRLGRVASIAVEHAAELPSDLPLSRYGDRRHLDIHQLRGFGA
jgi:FkbM family methyltransferase